MIISYGPKLCISSKKYSLFIFIFFREKEQITADLNFLYVLPCKKQPIDITNN